MLKKTFVVLLVLAVIVGVVLLAIPAGSNTSKRTAYMREYVFSDEIPTDQGIHTYVVSGPHEKDTPSFGTFQVATTVSYSNRDKKYDYFGRYTPIKDEDMPRHNRDKKQDCEKRDKCDYPKNKCPNEN